MCSVLPVLMCRATSLAAVSTPSSSDWALSKLSEINVISLARSLSVIITAGKR